jgi:hypothetical protein
VSGIFSTGNPEDMTKLVELIAPMAGLDPGTIAVVSVVIGDLEGRVAVVTGSATGTGKMSALAAMSLLANGIDHIITREIEAMGQRS